MSFSIFRILTVFVVVLFALPLISRAQDLADPNIISFDDNATACGGAVLCATNGNATTGGTTGYNGTIPFSFSTINSWFQVGGTNALPGQTMVQTATAGDFLVVNDTGAILTGLVLTVTTSFDASTPSVTFCSGGSGPLCDNFQANKGAAGTGTSFETFSGPDYKSCTNGTAIGMTCTSTAGQAAANFTSGSVTYTFGGYTIPIGGKFLIDFSSWNTSANKGPTSVTPEPGAMLLFGTGLLALGAVLRRRLTGISA